jgi:predicted Fe-Mo cluster-binding NifX family protein
MKFAVATKDYRKVAGHAGQARRWVVFSSQDGAPPVELERVELAAEMVFHVYREAQGPHPLDGVAALVFQTAGEGFLKRMGKKGIATALTSETNVARAAADFVAGTLKPPHPPGLMSLLCKVRDLFSDHI